jgi:hypothetical protein
MPVSVGPPRITLDKHGKEGVVYDVLVNTQVMTEMREDKTGGQRCGIEKSGEEEEEMAEVVYI